MITNQARVTTLLGGTVTAAPSNVVQLIVAERLDVALVLRSTQPTMVDARTYVPVLLTNAGSGRERFDLSALVDGTAHPVEYAIDRSGDGSVDGNDEVMGGRRTTVLEPGATLKLIAILDGVLPGANITLVAVAVTGSGTPGTAFERQGDGGGDAVVGQTGARAAVSVTPAQGTAAATLTKTQAVRDRRGGTVAEAGATITYTLVARFEAATAGATITDPIPAGTALVPGTLTLDGAAQTDAADGDAGEASDAAGVRVALGAMPAAATRTVTFQVEIQ